MLALQRTTHCTLRALSAALAGENLTAGEINALANLGAVGGAGATGAAGAEGSLSVRELSERTGTRASTLTGILDRLENRGCLVRELDAGDRRSFRLSLTEAGRALADRALAAIADLEREAFAGLSAEQVAGYHAVVTALGKAC